MVNIWKNETNFSQNDKVREQNTWALNTGCVRISLVRKHRNNPGVWVLHCYGLDIKDHDTRLLSSETPEVAQDYAISFIKNLLQKMIESLGGVENETI